MSDDPIRRFTLLVLFQAQKDQATELVVAPSAREGSPAIKYKVGDTWYALSPPPAEIITEMIADLGRLAALSQGVFPTRGIIDVAFSGVRLRWALRVPSAGAECILTPI